MRYSTVVYCAARDTLQSSRSVSAHDRLARVAGFQFLTVESWLPLVSSLPSELKHTDLTMSVCPLKVDYCVLGLSYAPKGDILAVGDEGGNINFFNSQGEELQSPVRVDKHDPEVMSHVLMVLSEEPLTRMLGLSGVKATHLT